MRSSSSTFTLSPGCLPIVLRMSAFTGSLWVPSPSAMKELRKGWPSIFPVTLTRPRVPKNLTESGQTLPSVGHGRGFPLKNSSPEIAWRKDLLFVRWAWRWRTLAAFGCREDGDAAVAGGVNGADGEDHVVFRDGKLEVEGGVGAGGVGPGWLVGFAPDDLVRGAGGGAGGRLPGEFGIVVEGRREDVDVLRLAGCGG